MALILNPSLPARKTALIIKFGQIGDVIMAVAAVRSLYDQGYRIEWACGKAARPLLACYSWLEVIPVDDAAIFQGPLLDRAAAVAGFWSSVMRKRYALCATLYYDRRFHLISLPVRAGRRIALGRQSRATTLLPGRHHTDEYARVLLALDDTCRESSREPLRPDRLPPCPLPARRAVRRVALVPGGTSNILGEQVLRRWPAANYVAVAEQLLARGWEVILLGGPGDAWVRPLFAHLAVTDCVGTNTLPEVVSLCDTCDAVISHDTGPLHLAGLSTACLVGIFGPTNPSNFLPRRPSSVAIWGGEGFACRPCYDGRRFAPCTYNGCMHQVSPARVLGELDRLLAARAEGIEPAWEVVSAASVNHGI